MAKKADADEVAAQLRNDDYEVCVAEVTKDVAQSVKAGDVSSVPKEVAQCLSDADICIILVSDDVDLGAIGGMASDSGCRVVTVGGSPDELPVEFDDIIDGHVPRPDSPQLPDIIEGEPALIRPDGTIAPRRKPKRVKCQ
jgi:hypothetical protein